MAVNEREKHIDMCAYVCVRLMDEDSKRNVFFLYLKKCTESYCEKQNRFRKKMVHYHIHHSSLISITFFSFRKRSIPILPHKNKSRPSIFIWQWNRHFWKFPFMATVHAYQSNSYANNFFFSCLFFRTSWLVQRKAFLFNAYYIFCIDQINSYS